MTIWQTNSFLEVIRAGKPGVGTTLLRTGDDGSLYFRILTHAGVTAEVWQQFAPLPDNIFFVVVHAGVAARVQRASGCGSRRDRGWAW